MQLDLTIYETTALRKMSEAYVIECNNKNINAIAPYVTSERKMISNNEIIDIFKGIATVKAWHYKANMILFCQIKKKGIQWV